MVLVLLDVLSIGRFVVGRLSTTILVWRLSRRTDWRWAQWKRSLDQEGESIWTFS